MSILGAIIGILIAAVFGGIVIWIVGKIGLGLEVDGFVPAFIAAIIIAVVAGIITWLLGLVGITIGGGILGAIVHLIIAAVVLMISGNIVPGMRVKGFGGALIAAIAIGVVAWLVSLIASGLGLA
ncbi:MAG: phage holin family protein [Anaerolineae bacterium]|nr:phage holin family protein [Anaerolineae bacterium]